MDAYSWYIIFPVSFVLGLVMGSFISVASYRLPHGGDIVFKPSYCPNCQAILRVADLVPIFSWLMQRGRCRYCRVPISWRYPLIECAMGFLFLALALMYGWTAHMFFLALLTTELAILIVTDLEHMIIPDGVQWALAITGFAYSMYHGVSMKTMAGSVGIGLSIGLALHWGYRILRHKDALGGGDVKFMAVAGFWIAPMDFVPFLFISGVLGTLLGLYWQRKSREAEFPFAPALALALLLSVIMPDMMRPLMVL